MSVLRCAISPITPFNAWVFRETIIALNAWYGAVLLAFSSNFYRTAVLGYFKKVLSAEEEQELLELIDSYRRGDLPLLGILTLLNHYVRKYGSTYLQKQYFLHPHPMELLLRFHA
jgi:hypothetical protein